MSTSPKPTALASFNATVISTDQRFSGTLTLRYNGRMSDVAFTDPSFVPVTVSLQEYALVNLAASYALTDSISIFGRVENLWDETYQTAAGYATPGRGAYLGAEMNNFGCPWGATYTEEQLEAKLLEGLNSAESELTPADWRAIRKEAMAKVVGAQLREEIGQGVLVAGSGGKWGDRSLWLMV